MQYQFFCNIQVLLPSCYVAIMMIFLVFPNIDSILQFHLSLALIYHHYDDIGVKLLLPSVVPFIVSLSSTITYRPTCFYCFPWSPKQQKPLQVDKSWKGVHNVKEIGTMVVHIISTPKSTINYYLIFNPGEHASDHFMLSSLLVFYIFLVYLQRKSLLLYFHIAKSCNLLPYCKVL